MSDLEQQQASAGEPSSAEKPSSADARARAAREALIGKTIAGRYVLRGLVGHGGMGAVYEGEQLGLGKRFAIKFIDAEFATDERVISRFAREARAMSAIESAHIVTVFDAGTDDGRPYLVMELLRGEDLGQWLRRAQRIPLADALHVVAQVLRGLARAHAAGIVHRDLKPDNVFLAKNDADPLFAKIIDFGISKIERPRDRTTPLALTGRGTVLGTPFYMCPEQAQAMPDVDGRADLYSVGAILFECLTGRPPHTGETYEQVILSICMRDAPDVRAIEPSVPAPVAAFVARSLSRDRNDRFATAERMLAALHDLAPDERRRVPLDPPLSPQTLLSAGAIADDAPVGAATRLDRTTPQGSLGVPVEVRAAQGAIAAAADARAKADGRPTPRLNDTGGATRRRSSTTLVATAAAATLLGVFVMLAIVVALDRKPEAGTGGAATSPAEGPETVAPTITSGVASGEVRPAVSAPPVGSGAGNWALSAAASTRPPGSGARKVPPPGKPLDIARDLP